ncbi:MAG: acyl-CoA dehydrogenase [Bdellovibrionales bacterium]|nr:acyl-CoA dehydrogenase [Bdellovibrionales bacterium]
MGVLEMYSGIFHNHLATAIVGTLFLFLTIGYLGLPYWLWTVLVSGVLLGFGAPIVIIGVYVAISLFFIIKPLRQVTLSVGVMKLFKALNFIPQISETERTALEAGVVWAEAELFSGKPDFKKLMSQPNPQLTPEEQAFIDGPVEQLCQMIDSWKIYRSRKIPDNIMQFIKDKKFLGMIIPKEYGGLGFSNLLHSDVIQKISTRSITASITVMVPNSLGPAELLVHYGTEEQKKKWLPRLADGREMPCFGLTEPQAGSDAGSIVSTGVLFKGDDGKIYVKINWRKRWITLASISSVIGLAFKLRDPENLLGRGEDLGITCALIPSNTKGVVLGKRHDPLTIPFYNCPTEGNDVIVEAAEAIIGGLDNAGKGWGMLMESLGAGRGISLPAQSTGGVKLLTLLASAHSTVRKQFGLSIGKFEGVEEPLARIAGKSYFVEAMRRYTLSALDQGIKPPVVTAMAKYNTTEWYRQAVNDGMDILGGAAISMGPRNAIAEGYIAAPISITVEGANILTRTLMIFGQGALRAHPYAFKEVYALENNDLKAFDRAFWGHIGHISRNLFRAKVLSWTRGWIIFGHGDSVTRRYYQKLAWVSAYFAIMADIAMGILGGKLKFKEKLTGRYADVLSWMYTATAVLHRYESEGKRKEDAAFVHYSMQMAFHNIQKAFEGILANFEGPFIVRWLFRGPVLWFASLNKMGVEPDDELTHEISKLIQEDSEQRQRLTQGIFIPKEKTEALGRYENAFKTIKQSEDIEKKMRKAVRSKILPKKRSKDLIELALEKGVITAEEHKIIKLSEELRWDTIQVDEFTEDEFINATRVRAALEDREVRLDASPETTPMPKEEEEEVQSVH